MATRVTAAQSEKRITNLRWQSRQQTPREQASINRCRDWSHNAFMPVNDLSFDYAVSSGAAALDPEALLNLQRLDPHGSERLFERLAAALELVLKRLLPGLDSALAGADPAAIAPLIHNLKSTAAALGALTLAAECAAIEALLPGGADRALLDRVQHLRDDLPSLLANVQALALNSPPPAAVNRTH